jgi:hypothetical protein
VSAPRAAASVPLLALILSLASAPAARAAGFASGPKLVPRDATGFAAAGSAVSLSGDGNTLLVGGLSDDANTGGAWVFVRTAGIWTQFGDKLVGSGTVGASQQGSSVALSADGKTALVGGPSDDAEVGAVWVFVRGANGFTQEGGKLVGTGRSGASQQGTSVAVSSDGTTALVGGAGDASGLGATWVFTKIAGVWSQQGAKLVGAVATATDEQGASVALSGSGATALVGAPGSGVGGAFVFTRGVGGTWSQLGGKLVGTGISGPVAFQGSAVALSADGGTALLGGPGDSTNGGATWAFVRTGGTFTQQGSKLVGSGSDSIVAAQGRSVALSGDGNTALVGGPGDESQVGSLWVFTRSGGVWTQQGAKLTGTGASGQPQQGFVSAISTNGETAATGGSLDDGGLGAAWVFMRQCVNGDANGDGIVNIADVFHVLNFLFASGPPPHSCF